MLESEEASAYVSTERVPSSLRFTPKLARFSSWIVSPHTVRRSGHSVDLTQGVRAAGVSHAPAGPACCSTAIVEQVWTFNFDAMTNVVDVYINYLRRKVDSGFDRRLIRTVRGVGYQIGGASPS